MPDANQPRTNSALWLGLLITVLGVLSNFLYRFKIPHVVIPWINLVVPAIGLIFSFIGVKRAFGQSQVYRGKIWGSVLTALAVVFCALSLWGFVHARNVPRSAGAPQVGQRAPDFTLPDISGQSVSLSQLLSSPVANFPRPKAVLLVFYRGAW